MPSSLIYDLDLEPQSVWYTVSSTPQVRSSMLYAQEIGNFYAGPKYHTSRDAFPSYLLKLSLDGCGALEYDGQRYRVPAGHFFWVDCNKPQGYCTDSQEDGWHVVWVHFNGGSAKGYYDAFMSINNGEPVSSLPLNSNAYSLFQELLNVAASEEEQLRKDIEIANLITGLLTRRCCICKKTIIPAIPLSPLGRDSISIHFTCKSNLRSMWAFLQRNIASTSASTGQRC